MSGRKYPHEERKKDNKKKYGDRNMAPLRQNKITR